jgi:hypothetical protein
LAFEDYRLNAQVRALLVRRCVDLSKVEHGVTNSVVYIKGSLRPYFMEVDDDLSRAKLQEIDIASKLERLLKAIPGVRDVVFQLDRVVKVGWRWKVR